MRNGGMNAQAEAAEVLANWRATYAEIFPHRNPEAMPVDDANLALVVMLRREMRAAAKASLTHRDLDRASRHDPKDPE